MSAKRKYDFGEKETEYSAKDGKELPVWQSPKYLQAKKAVINMLESDEYKDVLDESDFWILMNTTKTGKMMYTGLIISHNGCLKINDTLPDELKFNPICLNMIYKDEYSGTDKIQTYNDSLIFTYDSSRLSEDKQLIYEVGEVSKTNCKNEYPYAMSLKRCMDRVILKNSKLAYSGVYSDSEAEEFKEGYEATPSQEKKEIKATEKQLELIEKLFSENEKILELKNILTSMGKTKIVELTIQEASEIIKKEKGV